MNAFREARNGCGVGGSGVGSVWAYFPLEFGICAHSRLPPSACPAWSPRPVLSLFLCPSVCCLRSALLFASCVALSVWFLPPWSLCPSVGPAACFSLCRPWSVALSVCCVCLPIPSLLRVLLLSPFSLSALAGVVLSQHVSRLIVFIGFNLGFVCTLGVLWVCGFVCVCVCVCVLFVFFCCLVALPCLAFAFVLPLLCWLFVVCCFWSCLFVCLSGRSSPICVRMFHDVWFASVLRSRCKFAFTHVCASLEPPANAILILVCFLCLSVFDKLKPNLQGISLEKSMQRFSVLIDPHLLVAGVPRAPRGPHGVISWGAPGPRGLVGRFPFVGVSWGSWVPLVLLARAAAAQPSLAFQNFGHL